MSEEILLTPDAAAEAFEGILEGGPQPEGAEEEPVAQAEANEPAEEEEEEAYEADEANEEDELEEEEQQEARYKILVNGQEQEVTLDEMLKGYQRQSDYTRKTQALAEERKQNQQLVNEYSQRLAQVSQLAEQLQANPEIPEPNINWDKLYHEDPVEWTVQRQLYNDRQQLRAQRHQQLEVVKQEQQRLQQQQFASHLEEQRQRLLELVPEWQDAEVAKSEKSAIREFAKQQYGMTDNDVNQAFDARLVSMLRDAYLFRTGQAKAQEAVRPRAEKVPRTQGRSFKPENENTRLRKANTQLRKTGSVEDAEAVFEQMFG
jgi:hypothetical protein